MSGTGESTADFAGEERAFRIRLGEIRRIEAKSETGIGEVIRRLATCVSRVAEFGAFGALAAGVEIHADDVRETIYQGLVGGGMVTGEAAKLLRAEIDDRGVQGLLDNATVALSVLWGSQATPKDADAPGEPTAGESPATPESASTSEPSTPPDNSTSA